MREVVADTHAILWRFDAVDRLSPTARRALDDADRITISAITFWEIEMLRQKRRIELDRSTNRWRRDLLLLDKFGEAVVDGSVAVAAASLTDFHGDPADRLIVATALLHDATLVTKDTQIHSWSHQHELDVAW